MEPKKITSWHYEEETQGPSTYKDILPGDMVNERATNSAANQAFGKSVSKEIKEDIQYKQDLDKTVRELQWVNSSQYIIASRDGVNEATFKSGSYLFTKIFYWIFHPTPGAPQTKTQKILSMFFKVISRSIFVSIVCYAIWITAQYLWSDFRIISK